MIIKRNALEKVRREWKWIVPLFAVTILVSIIAIDKNSYGSATEPGKIEPDEKANYAVFATDIPEELTFAGEDVPLQFFDVREALDRELVSNTYFHSQSIRNIKLANRFFPVIEPILKDNNIPDDFKYLVIAESGMENVVSPAGAVGFWQITKGTGIDYGLEINDEVDERYHLEKATLVACKYLQESYLKYGNWTMAAASYNAGRRGMDREIDRQYESSYYDLLLNEETSRYIFRILAFKLIIDNPSEYGFHLSNQDLYPQLNYEIVEVSEAVSDFATWASEHNTNYKMLKYLNPWLRENKLTNSQGKTYQIRIILER
jgi:hypothetical protein